ncbi:MAG: hypothetical protein Q8942_16215, partial [Bacillota bacterium]|nr:hypothetical protein [Bacillota bacterium]
MNSKSFKKIICTVLCAIMLFASAISLNASGNYTGGSSGVSSSGGIVVPPELPAEMPLNSDGIKVFVSALIKENEDKIIEKVNGVDGDFKLRSIN